MRLLNTQLASGLHLTEFNPDEIPPYAILSHTWERDEVLYNDIISGTGLERAGYKKVRAACLQALENGYDYIWIDTCCIDKSSSAELSEAINSMYAWYRDSNVCYAWLSDFSIEDDGPLADCRWFTRGWTLQELIAPQTVIFYDADWNELGDKISLGSTITNITRISEDILVGKKGVDTASIANRMGWAARRKTTRPEDIAYCLMGIFSVNMPLVYGEGMRAFSRLQEEIMKIATDPSLFTWVDKGAPDNKQYGLLAPSPECFDTTHMIVPYVQWEKAAPSLMTNEGVLLRALIREGEQSGRDRSTEPQPCQAVLNCPPPGMDNNTTFLTVYLTRHGVTGDRFARVRASCLGQVYFQDPAKTKDVERKPIYVRPRPEFDVPATEALYPSHYANVISFPSSHAYRIIGMSQYANSSNREIKDKRSLDPQRELARFTEVRRGAGRATLTMVFERQSDTRMCRLVIGSEDMTRLAFFAEEIASGSATDIFENLPQSWSPKWMEMERRFRPTPFGETLRLPHHEVTVQSLTSAHASAKYYSLKVGIKPIGDATGHVPGLQSAVSVRDNTKEQHDKSGTNASTPGKQKGRLRQLMGSF